MKLKFQNMLIALASSLLWMSSASSEPERQLLWGDTHLHSSFSADAYMAGNWTAPPDVAYRYAKGEPVVHPYTRTRVQIQQPLDFLAVSDHAEFLGVSPVVLGGDFEQPEAGFFERIKSWFILAYMRYSIEDPVAGTKAFTEKLPIPLVESGDTRDPIQAAFEAGRGGGLEALGLVNKEASQRISATMWQASMQAAERHNQPGKFTTLVGWEWTQTASSVNLHRVVVSDADGVTASGFDPIGVDNAPYPEQLWDGLAELNEQTGANFVSIPHNSNISKGYMFAKTTVKGAEFTPEYAAKRARWEPIVEVTQIKGDSETHPELTPNDEFADFERFNYYLQATPQGIGYKAQRGDTVRAALQSGLELQAKLGVNPFKLGMIGSTDSHTSMASAEEPNFWGKLATDSIPDNKRPDHADGYGDGKMGVNGWNMSASGLAAVWSKDNSRSSIIEAMVRREVYATTGPRISVRVFAGWDFSAEEVDSPEFSSIGYARGVPMGGSLVKAPQDGVPKLMIQASKGVYDHNLDRIQVIKSWLTKEGGTEEKIYDVAWSGDRQIDSNGKLPRVGNSADIKSGITANTIGAADLSTTWADPDFDARQSAVYYVRVLQIPTVRHSQLDATALGIDTPYEGAATIQERAYTSPIWYEAGL